MVLFVSNLNGIPKFIWDNLYSWYNSDLCHLPNLHYSYFGCLKIYYNDTFQDYWYSLTFLVIYHVMKLMAVFLFQVYRYLYFYYWMECLLDCFGVWYFICWYYFIHYCFSSNSWHWCFFGYAVWFLLTYYFQVDLLHPESSRLA